jgi:o-succinylbenzoate synthase
MSEMAISSAEVIPYALPFREPYATARGVIERREMVLLRVRSEVGLEGLGEAVPLSLRGDRSLSQVVEELRRWAQAPDLPAVGLSPSARCAVQTAQLDLECKAEGVPMWRGLGANAVEPVACNATLAGGEPRHVAQRALQWVDEGFESFKLKVGFEDDDEQVSMVRRALGPDAKLRIDANGAWNPDRAYEHLRKTRAEGLELVEQPCGSLDELAELRRRIDIPIAADESVASSDDAAIAVWKEACDMATVKLSKVGGPLAALTLSPRLRIYLSSALDGPVGIAAAGHAAQALRAGAHRSVDAGVAHGLATQRLLSETIAARQCELRDGRLHLPDGPGLGVEIDEAALRRHRL